MKHTHVFLEAKTLWGFLEVTKKTQLKKLEETAGLILEVQTLVLLYLLLVDLTCSAEWLPAASPPLVSVQQYPPWKVATSGRGPQDGNKKRELGESYKKLEKEKRRPDRRRETLNEQRRYPGSCWGLPQRRTQNKKVQLRKIPGLDWDPSQKREPAAAHQRPVDFVRAPYPEPQTGFPLRLLWSLLDCKSSPSLWMIW